MATSLSLRVNLAELRATLREIGAENLPHTSQAIADGTELAQREWLQAAGGATVTFQGRSFAVNRRTGAYARSIQESLEYPAEGNPLHGRVSANTDYAEAIEKGTPSRDLKGGLLSGPRARVGKKGQRYVIIPFRHNTPTAKATGKPMPVDVYKEARKLAFTTVTGQRQQQNTRGESTTRASYSWGGTLNIGQGIGWRSRIAPQGREYTHAVSIYHGMYRMGSSKQSSFMTFRIVSENSPDNSWWAPAQEPRPVSEAVSEQVSERVTLMIRRGFELDLQGLEA